MGTANNSNKVKIATAIFVVISLCDLLGVIFNISLLRSIFKPLLMLTLLVVYLVSTDSVNKWYIGALMFSFFGDVLLLFEGKLYFILGLISFLIAHIIYIKIVLGWLKSTKLKTAVIAALPFLVFLLVLINLLKNNLNELLIPVIIYGIVISAMGLVSLLFYINGRSTVAKFMLTGACFFIISDAVLAINRFHTTNTIFQVIVMLTYLSAQYLILKAVLKYTEK